MTNTPLIPHFPPKMHAHTWSSTERAGSCQAGPGPPPPHEGAGLGQAARSPCHQGCLWWQSRAKLQLGHQVSGSGSGSTGHRRNMAGAQLRQGSTTRTSAAPSEGKGSPRSVFLAELLGASLQGCICLLFLSRPSAVLFLNWAWAQAAEPPGRSGEKSPTALTLVS